MTESHMKELYPICFLTKPLKSSIAAIVSDTAKYHIDNTQPQTNSMKIKFLNPIVLMLTFTCQYIKAQESLPILKSNISTLSIKEGNAEYKEVWSFSPEVKPDIFITNPFTGKKRITFYSDIDSISFLVKPNRKYDFIILLKGIEKAYTQINTDQKAIPSLDPKMTFSRIKKILQTTDTIPFTLAKDNRIHLKGKINNSDPLDFLFDTGAGSCVITSSLVNKKVTIAIDGSQENGGADGIARVEKSSRNTIEINNLKWEAVPLLSIDYQQPSFDAVLGWIAFENNIIEIDYEKKILVVHQSLPIISAQYSRLQFKLIEGIPYVKLKLVVNGNESEDWFDFDTGSDGLLVIGQKFAREHGLNDAMKKIGKVTSVGSTGKEIISTLVMLPKMKLGDFEMYQIPLSIQAQEIENVEHSENIGNKILKRFNTIIDFRNNNVYLKPNNLFYTPILKD